MKPTSMLFEVGFIVVGSKLHATMKLTSYNFTVLFNR